MPESFFSQYLRYTEDTESPRIFHRWSALSSIGALLGRNFYFEHGHFNVQPNLYVMLMGTPGTRKTTSIKMGKKLITSAGYNTIAADKTSKEKFLVDLEGIDTEDTPGIDKVAKNLFGDSAEVKEVFVMADEFNEFMGINNLEFISLLGTLWDYEGVYKSRIKTGKSVAINNPTVSILGGNTQQGFATAFPPQTIGQGFLSRLILIYGEVTGRKITFPKRPPEEDTMNLVRRLQEIQLKIRGRAQLTTEASSALDTIYSEWEPLSDSRFTFYSTRRFSQLLKLIVICSAACESIDISVEHVIEANTYLSAAEYNMPKALGEFGKNKDSDVAHKIMEALTNATKALSTNDIWMLVHRDLKTQVELGQILQGLCSADKIFHENKFGWLIKPIKKRTFGKYFDASFLTQEERETIHV